MPVAEYVCVRVRAWILLQLGGSHELLVIPRKLVCHLSALPSLHHRQGLRHACKHPNIHMGRPMSPHPPRCPSHSSLSMIMPVRALALIVCGHAYEHLHVRMYVDKAGVCTKDTSCHYGTPISITDD